MSGVLKHRTRLTDMIQNMPGRISTASAYRESAKRNPGQVMARVPAIWVSGLSI